MADATNSAPLFNSGRPLPTQHTNLDLAMHFVAERLESLDRIWDLVLGAESEGQGFVPTSAIRAAISSFIAQTKALTAMTAERDAARAEVERLKKELAAGRSNFRALVDLSQAHDLRCDKEQP